MKKWSLNGKVTLVITILVLGAVGISFMGIRGMSSINQDLKDIIAVDVKRDQMTTLITDAQRLAAIALRDVVIERNAAKIKVFQQMYNEEKDNVFKYTKEYMALLPEGSEQLELAKNYHVLAEKFFAANDRVIPLAAENKDAEVAELREKEVAPLVIELNAITAKLNAVTAKDLERAAQESQSSFESGRNSMLFISFICIAASLALAFVILRAVTNAIDQVIVGLTDSSNQVTSAAQQIAASSEELSQAATEQASSLEQTAASIQEMSSMVLKNAESAKRTSDLSNSSHEKAEKGKLVVQDMIKAIDDISQSNVSIKNQVDDSNQQIAEIVQVISEIGNKTKVINDIVFQTKLLSFNASVEAARAGEHGKGFAVVAEEVGNLAQMSGNAAKEITEMLEGSIQKVEGIVNDTKQKIGHLIIDGKAKVEAGIVIANQCGTVLSDIVDNVAHVTQMSNEISVACNEQSVGVQEITKAMSQLDQVTQTNAATSEEAASAAVELSSQAESLRNTVGVLHQEIKGGDGQLPTQEVRRAAPEVKKQSKSNVVPFKKSPTAKIKMDRPMAKKVVGLENNIPSENDARFEDV